MRNTAAALAGIIAASVLLFSTAVAADEDVLKAKGCLNCHDMDKKKVGPAFKEVAAKKAGKKDELVAKISGAKGHPKVNASEAEIKAAVDKVLSTK